MKIRIAAATVALVLLASGCSGGSDSGSGQRALHGCVLFRQVATDYTKHDLRGRNLLARMKRVESAMPDGSDVHAAVAATLQALRRGQDKNTAAGIDWISDDCAKVGR